MVRRSKKDRPPAIVQAVLSDNLSRLRDRRHPELPNDTQRNKALAANSDTSLSQVQRIIAQELAPGVDIIERLARALNVRPQDLLTPYFAAELKPPNENSDPERQRPRQAVHE